MWAQPGRASKAFRDTWVSMVPHMQAGSQSVARDIHLICSLSTSVNQAVFQAAAPLQNAYLWRLSSVLALQGVHMAFRMAQYTWAAGSPLPSRALLA